MKNLLWIFGVIFWPLTAAIISICFVGLAVVDKDLADAAESLYFLFLAAIGGYIAYLGYFPYFSANNVADIIKIIYLFSVVFWAAAAPLPKELLE